MHNVKRLLIISWFVLVTVGVSQGQQQPVNSQYMFNTLTINPAFAGYYDQVDFMLSSQGQLNGMEGAPSSTIFTANIPFNKIGVGATFINDKAGPTISNSINGSYAFKIVSKNKNSYTESGFFPTKLSIALNGGLTLIKEDLLQLGAGNDPNFSQNTSLAIPTFGFGAYYSKRNFYVGISAPQLLVGNGDELNRHFYLNGGIVFQLDKNWLLKPNGLIKYVQGAPIQFDVNSIFSYRRKFDFGIGYRSATTINFLAGFTASKHIRIVYFYTPPTQNVLLNTHSLLLNIRLGNGFSSESIEKSTL